MSHIEELASSIASNTSKIGVYLRTNSLPFPSFDVRAPVDLSLTDENIRKARHDVLVSCLELIDLIQGPQACLFPSYNGAPLQFIYRFDVASKVPIEGLISFTDLAKACGDLYESDLRSIIRYAIVYHRCFCEPVKNMVGHSAASRLLAENHNVRDGVGQMFDGHQLAFTRICAAVEPGKSNVKNLGNTAWALAYGSSSRGIFGDMDADAGLASRFQGAMKHFMQVYPGANPDVLVGYDLWHQLAPGATVVDVGGGDGWVGRLLLRAYPELKVIVQDKANMLNLAKTSLNTTSVDAGIEFQNQDFFEQQTIQGVDVFLLRWILHDWPDAYAVSILRALIPALKDGSRIVINDFVSPGQVGVQQSLLSERALRQLDMVVLANFNSYEREIEDWQRIIQEADPRFGRVKSTQSPMSNMAILELEWNV